MIVPEAHGVVVSNVKDGVNTQGVVPGAHGGGTV